MRAAIWAAIGSAFIIAGAAVAVIYAIPAPSNAIWQQTSGK